VKQRESAWARIFLGLHYPLDMLGGYAVAAFGFVVISALWWQIGRQTIRAAIGLYRFFAR
jgi:undecaprenyl-diphosphatase